MGATVAARGSDHVLQEPSKCGGRSKMRLDRQDKATGDLHSK